MIVIYCYLMLKATINTLGRGVFKNHQEVSWLYLVRIGCLLCLSVFLLERLVSHSTAAACHVKYTVAQDKMSFIFGEFMPCACYSRFSGIVVDAMSL